MARLERIDVYFTRDEIPEHLDEIVGEGVKIDVEFAVYTSLVFERMVSGLLQAYSQGHFWYMCLLFCCRVPSARLGVDRLLAIVGVLQPISPYQHFCWPACAWRVCLLHHLPLLLVRILVGSLEALALDCGMSDGALLVLRCPNHSSSADV